jgi:hypothetical protein
MEGAAGLGLWSKLRPPARECSPLERGDDVLLEGFNSCWSSSCVVNGGPRGGELGLDARFVVTAALLLGTVGIGIGGAVLFPVMAGGCAGGELGLLLRGGNGGVAASACGCAGGAGAVLAFALRIAASYRSSSIATPFSNMDLSLSIRGSKASVLPLRARYMARSSSSSLIFFACSPMLPNAIIKGL